MEIILGFIIRLLFLRNLIVNEIVTSVISEYLVCPADCSRLPQMIIVQRQHHMIILNCQLRMLSLRLDSVGV